MKRTAFLSALVFLLAALVWMLPAVQAAETSTRDSEEVSGLLSQAKTHAVQMKEDAHTMESFARSKVSWQAHSRKISEIREHVNKLGEVVGQLNEARETASPWQQQAIDRITPLLKEVASNTESAIDHLNNNPGRVHTSPYTDYVVANYDLTTELAALVGNFVDYGKTKAKFEKLTESLEVAKP